MFIHFWEVGEGQKERKGDTESKAVSRLWAIHTEPDVDWTHEPWDHDLNSSRTLNGLSHPGSPAISLNTNLVQVFPSLLHCKINVAQMCLPFLGHLPKKWTSVYFKPLYVWSFCVPLLMFNMYSIFFLFCFLKKFFNVYFWDRERQSMNGGGSEREGDTESETGSTLWVVSTEPDAGFELTHCEIRTWAEVGRLTDWATQAPLACIVNNTTFKYKIFCAHKYLVNLLL